MATRPQKNIKEVYQKKSQLEHILLRPDIYVGSIEKHTRRLWIYDDEAKTMVHRWITYVPALYKIFDEILLNAFNNKRRDPKMDTVKVEIDSEQNLIIVYNNGVGVPVEIHQEECVYVPEMVFGQLLTSSNYDNDGCGAKLANIFSSEFVIETADGKRLKKFKQVFCKNMRKKFDPIITKCKEGENWTKVSCKPDLEKFNMTHLDDDVIALMKKRVIDLAGCLGKTLKVELNGRRVPVKTFEDYVNMYPTATRYYEKVNDRWEVCVSVCDEQFQQVSFVNGISTIKGGTHVDYVANQIANHVMTFVNQKNKNANIKARKVKNNLWVFVNAHIDNPAFDSQTKETLTLRQSSFGSKCELREEFLNKVTAKSGIVENLLSRVNLEQSKDLILFSMADHQKSIPSIVDGLNLVQRKILFCCFKRNFVKEEDVAQFSGYVSEHSAYHDEQSLASTIVGMAHDFVGSNNINLLQPNGQFGTRLHGGKDAAGARYISTRLSPITRFLFPKVDDMLLDYLNGDGQSIEPKWYMPIIPMVLVNGSEGIGPGWSSYVPNYNPRDIVANLRRLLNDEMMKPMHPWYRGFTGTIEKTASKEAGFTYIVSGIIQEYFEHFGVLRILELPIGRWIQDYKEFLESLSQSTDSFIERFSSFSNDKTVSFDIFLSEKNMMRAKQEGLLKKFNLTTTICTNNMYLFDPSGAIKKYDTPEQILVDFFYLRLEYYTKRKEVQLENLKMEILKLENKVRFICEVLDGEIILDKKVLKTKTDLLLLLQRKGFTPFRKNPKPVEVAGALASDYEYLLSMPIGSLTPKKVEELLADRDKLQREVEELSKATPKLLWEKDLEALEKELDELDKTDACAEEERMLLIRPLILEPGSFVPGKNVKEANNAKGFAETIGESSTFVLATGSAPNSISLGSSTAPSGPIWRNTFWQQKPNTSWAQSLHVDEYIAKERCADSVANSTVTQQIGSAGGRAPSMHVDKFMARERECWKHIVTVVGEPAARVRNAAQKEKLTTLKHLHGIDIVFDDESEPDDKFPFPQLDDNLQQSTSVIVEQSSPHSDC